MNLMSKADLHLHTTYSDGRGTVPEVLAHVACSDLRLIAITDHDTIAGAVEAHRLASAFGVQVIVGEEVTTAEGELLALFIDSALPPGRPAAETIAAVHAQGGLCIAPHPFAWGLPSLGKAGLRQRCAPGTTPSGVVAWQLDALEGFNASLTWPRSACNLAAQRAAHELGVPAVGGSDAHAVATIGRGYTLFPGRSVDDLYRAIQRHHLTWGGRCIGVADQIDYCWHIVRRSARQACHMLANSTPA